MSDPAAPRAEAALRIARAALSEIATIGTYMHPEGGGLELDRRAKIAAVAMADMEAALAALGASEEARPVAWMRGHCTPGSADGPTEYDADFVYGDDPPEGSGWEPLYRAALSAAGGR